MTNIILWHKAKLRDKLVLEMKIMEVSSSSSYPDKIRYRLICKDLVSGRYVLLDNHHPKGHHLHWQGRELPYEFKSEEKLIEDFRELVEKEFGESL